VSNEHHIVVQDDQETGRRLKYWSRAADTAYWTELWAEVDDGSYRRELKGHQPHQLRATFQRWVRPGARVLEAGCGLAHFTVAAHARGYRAEGIDWSPETIDKLRGRFPQIPWHVGDVRKLDFDDDVFDAVYSPGVVEHFEEGPAQILRETRRVLAPGGYAVVSTPCFNTWLRGHPGRYTSTGTPAGEFYQYAFSPEGLAALLGRLGFEVVQVRPYGSLATLLRYGGRTVPAPLVKPLAVAMDYAPVTRAWGSTCIWVARKL
jgi:SAM-dependent methyltransferase